MNQKIKTLPVRQAGLPISISSTLTRLIFITLSFASYALPFLLGHPQLLVGSLVNAALFLSATFLPQKLFLPIIFFPSLAVLSRGLIFGPLTSFLLYMIPFIWLGNLLLVLSFKKAFNLTKANYPLSIIAASIIKMLFLYFSATTLFKLSLVPQLFLTTMGLIQGITALVGGILALITVHLAMGGASRTTILK
jgi:hypothetical protein